MSIKEKAIKIAINTFLSEYEGTELEVYNRLRSEEHDDWYDIEYASVWCPFENDSVNSVVSNIDTLVGSIVKTFGE